MRIAVIGGSAAGQFSALLLARAGHDVVLMDRDDLEPAAELGEAEAGAFRSAAPQIVQPHALLPRCRLLLRDHLPDVHDELMHAGAVESVLANNAPPTITLQPEPDDDDYTALSVRRLTVDWVLQRIVAEEARISHRYGVRATGLLADAGSPLRVVGVHTSAGDMHADLVVDASGRRSHLDAWLTAAGAQPTQVDAAECGLAYHSRHYRVRKGGELPGPPGTRILLPLDEFTAGMWNGDNGTALIAVAPMVEDKRFAAVRKPAVFDAVVRSIPAFRPWLAALEPSSDVYSMGGLHNTWRHLLVDGRPIVTGLAVVGDSRCTTNPTLGRGLPLALIGALDLLAALRSCGDDLQQLAGELEARASANLRPFFLDQARNDAARLGQLRSNVFGAPFTPMQRSETEVSFDELRAAMISDPQCVRPFWRVMGMLDLPQNVYADPEVVRRTRAALQTATKRPVMPQPTTAELEAALAGSALV